MFTHISADPPTLLASFLWAELLPQFTPASSTALLLMTLSSIRGQLGSMHEHSGGADQETAWAISRLNLPDHEVRGEGRG